MNNPDRITAEKIAKRLERALLPIARLAEQADEEFPVEFADDETILCTTIRGEDLGEIIGTDLREAIEALAALNKFRGAQDREQRQEGGWRHAANEWADMATSGLQWLKNVRDGISTMEDAIYNMEECLTHCQDVALSAPPPHPQDQRSEAEGVGREKLGELIYRAMYERDGGKWHAVEPREVWFAKADFILSALAASPSEGEVKS